MSSTRYEPIRTPTALFAGQQVQFSGFLFQAAKGLFDRVYAWQERAQQRAQLAALDDRLLTDAGITHAEVTEEVAKPFWRA